MTEQVGEPQAPTPVSSESPSDSSEAPSKSIDELVAALGDDEAEADDEANEVDVASSAVDDAPIGDTVELVERLPIEPDDDLTDVEGEASARLVSIVESLLFAANRPLTVRGIRKALSSEPSKRQIQLALKQLEVDTSGRGVVLRQVAGGFVLRTNPDNAQYVQRLLQARPVRLSRPQLESLAVIVYRQPITRAEIDHVRGVDSGAVLKLLLERDLIKIVGRKEEPGRPMLYGTTVKFLEFFDLKSLRDLPDLHEFRELSDVSKDRLRTSMDEDELEVFGQEVIDFAREGGEEPAEGPPSSDEEREHESAGEESTLNTEAADDEGELDLEEPSSAEQSPEETRSSDPATPPESNDEDPSQ